jgi:DNA invertase Pin-like site-specific DNA recombinase
MDRLSRNALLVAGLMINKIKFVAVDKPNATPLDHLQDAINAEREGDRIRKRTKEGLQAAKAKGVELGKYGKVLAGINRDKADAFAREKGPIIQALHDEGYSYEGIARKWNKEGLSSFREGCNWHASTIYDVWKRSTSINQNMPVPSPIID